MKGWFARPTPPDDTGRFIKLMREQQQSNERIINTVTEVVNKQAAATTAMATSFSNYLELFKVTSPPEVRTTNDEKEAIKELKKKGYPVDGTPEEQIRFLFRDQ